ISDFFNGALEVYNNPKSISSFIIVELLRRVNLGEVSMDNLPFSSKDFAVLVQMADEEKVSKNDAKTILRFMVETGKNPEEIAKENGFLITNDTGKVEEVIENVLSANKAIVEQWLSGEQKVFGFLMGQCTKELKGVCTPKVVKDILEAKLNSMK
ncbi:MAG TPA: Asp-tRNA(Asn)/Glu-tRNA(Gln) amidotransferase GatCAB subunit B, partial [Oscillospiraceae bacterium]|nr:Asp-tRNA(Asn)/Glu-tRNA(Gln) amidotransferase GatCAB subunit B [Oscillospiraceae bacterium]